VSDCSITYLKDHSKGQLAEAVLIDGVSRDDVERAEAAWQSFLVEQLDTRKRTGNPQTRQLEHSHWDWRKKHLEIEGSIVYRMFGVECDGEFQGLMLISTVGHPCGIED
jgi:hypothetical protein